MFWSKCLVLVLSNIVYLEVHNIRKLYKFLRSSFIFFNQSKQDSELPRMLDSQPNYTIFNSQSLCGPPLGIFEQDAY